MLRLERLKKYGPKSEKFQLRSRLSSWNSNPECTRRKSRKKPASVPGARDS